MRVRRHLCKMGGPLADANLTPGDDDIGADIRAAFDSVEPSPPAEAGATPPAEGEPPREPRPEGETAAQAARPRRGRPVRQSPEGRRQARGRRRVSLPLPVPPWPPPPSRSRSIGPPTCAPIWSASPKQDPGDRQALAGADALPRKRGAHRARARGPVPPALAGAGGCARADPAAAADGGHGRRGLPARARRRRPIPLARPERPASSGSRRSTA